MFNDINSHAAGAHKNTGGDDGTGGNASNAANAVTTGTAAAHPGAKADDECATYEHE